MNGTESKPLGKSDQSAFDFVQECLGGGSNFAVNFDRLAFDHLSGRFIVIEFQKVDQWQAGSGITPHTSHPVKYWDRCWRKYIALWRAVQKLEADFYVINYSEKGSPFEDQIRVMQIFSLNSDGIKKWSDWKCTRTEFAEFFREMNLRCRGLA